MCCLQFAFISNRDEWMSEMNEWNEMEWMNEWNENETWNAWMTVWMKWMYEQKMNELIDECMKLGMN